jgi:enoyl-CoA hydratase/carnithine racemase
MSQPLVLRSDDDGLVTLVLNRPDKLNAINSELFEELSAHIDAIAAATDSVGCVVLRGAGRCFSAGHDLGAIGAGETAGHLQFQSLVVERLANLPQPVITAVHGHCYTGALELALAGDLILASDSARFADTHAKWGLTPVWGMSQRLPRRVGVAKAREMMFLCRTYSGAEAQAMGLVNACFAEDAFDAEVTAWARAVLANSWFSHRANKRLLVETDGLPLGAGLAHEIHRSAGIAPDAGERVARFSQRRG